MRRYRFEMQEGIVLLELGANCDVHLNNVANMHVHSAADCFRKASCKPLQPQFAFPCVPAIIAAHSTRRAVSENARLCIQARH